MQQGINFTKILQVAFTLEKIYVQLFSTFCLCFYSTSKRKWQTCCSENVGELDQKTIHSMGDSSLVNTTLLLVNYCTINLLLNQFRACNCRCKQTLFCISKLSQIIRRLIVRNSPTSWLVFPVLIWRTDHTNRKWKKAK